MLVPCMFGAAMGYHFFIYYKFKSVARDDFPNLDSADLKFLLILLIENILCTGTHRPAASNRVAWRLTAASADDRTQMPYSGHPWPGPVEVRSSADAAVRRYSSPTSGRCSYPMYW